MNTIGKFRTNFLGKGRSFKIGFNNRSPFSYISSTGPAVPASYDGGVPLVNFTPDQYAQAFDTTEAVKAEGKMYEKAGKAAGQAVSAVAGAIAGGIEAGKTGTGGAKGGGSFGEIMKGAGKGFKEKGKSGFIGGLGQGYGDLAEGGDDDEKIKFADMTIDNATPEVMELFMKWKADRGSFSGGWDDFITQITG